MPSQMTLVQVRNRTGRFNISVFQSDGTTPQDLTGAILDYYADAIHKYSPSNGITITNAGSGLAQLKLDPADTSGFTTPVTIPGELTLSVSGDVDSVALGPLIVVMDATVT